MATLKDQSGTTVFKGTGQGFGGAQPVTVFLRVHGTPLDIHGAGSYPAKWDSALDNPWDFNTLSSLPAGLGITAAIDGSDGTITTTAAGTWAFTFCVGVDPDATWYGTLHLDDNAFVGQSGAADATAVTTLSAAEAVTYPAGAIFVPAIETQHAATANPYNVQPTLLVVRLA